MKRKFSGKSATDNIRIDPIELHQEDLDLGEESELYCDAYKELAELIGVHNTRKVWQHYHGLTIQFPQRLYSRAYTREYIRANMDVMPIKEMAIQLSLTDRRVRQIVKEIRREQ